MISFDLVCSKEHRFEVWFANSSEFKKQISSKKVICPICGDHKIEKSLMTPNITSKQNKKSKDKIIDNHDSNLNAVAKANNRSPELLAAFEQLRGVVEKNCDYVGKNFAEEARKITYGESKERSIYGETSADEAKELSEEGIEFGVLPWPNRGDA